MTSGASAANSAACLRTSQATPPRSQAPPRTLAVRSLDHLIGGRQQRFRDGEPERFGGLEVDDKLNFCGLLHRQIGRFVAFENAPGIYANLVVVISDAAAIAHQAAGQGELAVCVDRGQRMASRQRRELFRAPMVEGTVADQDRTNALLRKSCESRFEIAIGSGIHNKELQAKRARCRLQVCSDGLDGGLGQVGENAEQGNIGRQLAEQLQSFL